eukprot:m.159799 g.159799  ORF g.159799 m.159799 type:complete len:237 (+) comp20919_c0_seq2:723-1433(+)
MRHNQPAVDLFACTAMSFLADLLNEQEAPVRSKEEIDREKRKREIVRQRLAKEEEEMEKFREKIWKELKGFVASEGQQVYTAFGPMEGPFRAVVHEVSKELELVSHGFGQEGLDRKVVVFKKASAPPPDLIVKVDRNLSYSECMLKIEVLKKRQASGAAGDIQADPDAGKVAPKKMSSKEKQERKRKQQDFDASFAAVPTAPSRVGLVSLAQRQDRRTVEETLKDLKERKKKQTEE